MKLDFSSLENAIASLEKAIKRSASVPGDEEIRDSVIKRFEYTYELCWKMLKRVLEVEAPVPAHIDSLSFRELIREGAERGLVADASKWMVFREKRNISSHTYNEEKAKEVHGTALEFLPEARDLLSRLKSRNNDQDR